MNRYEGAAEAFPSKCVLISYGRKVGSDDNGGDGGSTKGGGRGGRSIVDQRNNLARFTMHGKLTASGADLAAEKAVSNRGSGPAISPRRLSWPSRVFWKGWWRERRLDMTATSWGIWYTSRGRGVFHGKEGPNLYIKGPNPNYTFWSTFVRAHLYLSVLFFFKFAKKTWHILNKV